MGRPRKYVTINESRVASSLRAYRKAQERDRLALRDSTKPTHVIIGGTVFEHKAKEPYVPAGYSISGGLEYNQEKELLLCHVCGDWVKELGRHAKKRDGVSPEEYRRNFGLRSTTSLVIPRYHHIASERALHNRGLMASRKTAGLAQLADARASLGQRADKRNYGCAETQNLTLRCREQLRARINKLAVQVGGTPTIRDMREAGIYPYSVEHAFSMKIAAVLRSFGLTPNPPHMVADRSPERCATIRAHILQLAAQVGGAPTYAELLGVGLVPATIESVLGMKMPEVMQSLGFAPNTTGTRTKSLKYKSNAEKCATYRARKRLVLSDGTLFGH
jgi:hypothetical protein